MTDESNDVVAVGEANSSARGFFAIVTADADSDTDAQYAVEPALPPQE